MASPRQYKPVTPPACPCCKQPVPGDTRLLSWQSYRKWLVTNWEWAARELVRELAQLEQQTPLSLAEHPDLLWALKADAGEHQQELNDRLAEIVDGYFQGLTDDLKRRSLKLKLPPVLECKFCAGPMQWESVNRWRCTREPWHSFHVNRDLPAELQGVWMGPRYDARSGPGPLPESLKDCSLPFIQPN